MILFLSILVSLACAAEGIDLNSEGNDLAIINTTRLNDCITGYYLSTDGRCLKCQPPCRKCDNATSCTQCPSQHFMNSQGKCEACPKNCWQCDNSTVCFDCNGGYYVTSNGQCESCVEDGCYICSNATFCTECFYNRYVTLDGRCGHCAAGILHCEVCNATACVQCRKGAMPSPDGGCEYKLCSEDDWNYIFGDRKNSRTSMPPVYSETNRIDISLNMSLIELLDLDEQQESLTTTWHVSVGWNDLKMKWEPDEYGNCGMFLVTNKEVWIPHLTVVNTFDSAINLRFFNKDKAVVKAHHHEYVSWDFAGELSTTCELDMTYYPFDTQTCTIEIESTILSSNRIKLTTDLGDTFSVEFADHNQWMILSTSVVEGSRNNTSQLIFSVELARKPLHVFVNVAVPIILLNILTMAVFFIPYEERLSFSITIFLTFMVLTMVIAEKLPESSNNMPLLSIYAMWSMICSVVVLFAIAMVLSKSQISTNERPKGFLASTLLCIDRFFSNLWLRVRQNCGFKEKRKLSNDRKDQTKDYELALCDERNNSQPKSDNNIEQAKYENKDIADEKDANEIKHETTWVHLAAILDRLFFYFFVILNIVIFVIVFIVVPIKQSYKFPEYRYNAD